jgi:BTB/POZ domain
LEALELFKNKNKKDGQKEYAKLEASIKKQLVRRVDVAEERVEELEGRMAVLERPASTNASLLLSEAFSDLVIVCGDGARFLAHRCILAACSQPLRASLQGPWAENTKREVEMNQSGAAVQMLLRFMYTGKTDVNVGFVEEVIELAELYEQHALKEAYEWHAMDCNKKRRTEQPSGKLG